MCDICRQGPWSAASCGTMWMSWHVNVGLRGTSAILDQGKTVKAMDRCILDIICTVDAICVRKRMLVLLAIQASSQTC
eukprot:scaffold117919_cov18-Tisochrysis_lutea.AAC.3